MKRLSSDATATSFRTVRITAALVMALLLVAGRKRMSHRAAPIAHHIDAETAPKSARMTRQRRPPTHLNVLQRILVAVAAVDGRLIDGGHRGCLRCRHAFVITAADDAAAGAAVAAAQFSRAQLLLLLLLQVSRMQFGLMSDGKGAAAGRGARSDGRGSAAKLAIRSVAGLA